MIRVTLFKYPDTSLVAEVQLPCVPRQGEVISLSGTTHYSVVGIQYAVNTDVTDTAEVIAVVTQLKDPSYTAAFGSPPSSTG